jgi:hypothetical protein
MTQQAAETANALWTRLQPHFDDTHRPTVENNSAGWPAGFGSDMPDIRTIVVHGTQGWPTRHGAPQLFISRYTDPNVNGPTGAEPSPPPPKKPLDTRGIGPHFYMSHDGTVFRLLTETRVCWHASYVNLWAIGVETGNLMEVAPPTGPNHWSPLSADANDFPGAKLYARSVNQEMLVALWSTSLAAQTDSHPAGTVMMLYSEEQYRSWALLARWLAEVWQVPRNFPVRPHLMRGHTWQAANFLTYRQLVDADPMRDMHIRTQLQPPPRNCNSADFESDDPAQGLPHKYRQAVQPTGTPTPNGYTTHPVNDMWTRFFSSYRGFHGHGYAGAVKGDDHNCPGARFDWHRFARDVWDYWWAPFDLVRPSPTAAIVSGQPERVYGGGDGVLHEHYFDEDPSLYGKVTTSGFYPAGDETVVPHSLPGPPLGPIGNLMRTFRRYWGFWHGGMHFQLAAGSPVYGMAAGQLVAARLSTPDADEDFFDRENPSTPYPSARFLLLRHEVFWQRRAGSDRIDYDQEPTRVYSLYMHLGLIPGVNLGEVVTANPVWLNRAIAMKKECDLGLAFHTAHPQPAAQWTPHVTRWQRRQAALQQALADLQAGHVARFPEGEDAVRVSLGDLLGNAGHLAANTFGLHLEVFSNDAISDPWFERIDQSASATRPFHDERNLNDVTTFLANHFPGQRWPMDLYRDLPAELKATRFKSVALRSKSEWALEAADFPDGGWGQAEPFMWWPLVVPPMNTELATEPLAQLPADKVVWHYHPLGFMAWLNDLTWKSEWPKFRIVDAAGVAEPVPPTPPPHG